MTPNPHSLTRETPFFNQMNRKKKYLIVFYGFDANIKRVIPAHATACNFMIADTTLIVTMTTALPLSDLNFLLTANLQIPYMVFPINRSAAYAVRLPEHVYTHLFDNKPFLPGAPKRDGDTQRIEFIRGLDNIERVMRQTFEDRAAEEGEYLVEGEDWHDVTNGEPEDTTPLTLDTLLQKISKHGLDSLTAKERQFLDNNQHNF